MVGRSGALPLHKSLTLHAGAACAQGVGGDKRSGSQPAEAQRSAVGGESGLEAMVARLAAQAASAAVAAVLADQGIRAMLLAQGRQPRLSVVA